MLTWQKTSKYTEELLGFTMGADKGGYGLQQLYLSVRCGLRDATASFRYNPLRSRHSQPQAKPKPSRNIEFPHVQYCVLINELVLLRLKPR